MARLRNSGQLGSWGS
uniref:Uncharacterized protein n=1 Tax=Rhizophora mucronata TaxID=61149 RepID=A0A2P2NDJ1_RHIMU